jgi:hypothetical protein
MQLVKAATSTANGEHVPPSPQEPPQVGYVPLQMTG